MRIIVIGVVNTELMITGVTGEFAFGEQISFERHFLRYGGAATNVARAVTSLGKTVSLLSAVGEDDYGRALLENLASCGLDTGNIVVLPGRTTGLAVVLVSPSSERGIISDAGAMKDYTVRHVRDSIGKIHKDDLVLMTGLFLAPSLIRSGLAELFGEIREQGGITILDPGWSMDGYSDETRRQLFRLLPDTDYFLPSEPEAITLARTDTVDEATDMLVEGYPGLRIIVTLGRDGCVYADAECRLRRPAYQVAARDSTAAGDAFAGGLLYALTQPWAIGEKLDFASAVAGHVVCKLESRYGDLKQITELQATVPHYIDNG